MSVPLSYYNSEEIKRTLGPDWQKSAGSQDQPLFKIPLGLILEVIDRDELHCMFLTI